MDQVQEILPFLIPIAILQVGLLIAALVDLLRRERTRGPKWVWLLVVLFVSFIGPIVYFMLGREE
jgi:hypothetical protein